jgi:hypothetical protein
MQATALEWEAGEWTLLQQLHQGLPEPPLENRLETKK